MARKRPKISPNKVSPNVSLDICKSIQSAPWVNVKVSNAWYSYLFTGGDTGHGDVYVSVSKNPGKHAATVELIAPKRYRISSCVFTDDANNQLGWELRRKPHTIGNRNTAIQDAKYTILVEDTGNGSCVIPCDPGVRNLP